MIYVLPDLVTVGGLLLTSYLNHAAMHQRSLLDIKRRWKWYHDHGVMVGLHLVVPVGRVTSSVWL